MANQVLAWDALVPEHQLTVTVTDGWVTIAGHVDLVTQRHEAEHALARLSGVRGVASTITVTDADLAPNQIRHAIAQALQRRAGHRVNHPDITIDGRAVATIAISTDTHFAHWMWKKTSPTVTDVTYPMGGDPAGTVSRAHGVWKPATGLNRRGRFIIDPDGIIQGVEVLAEPIGRNTDELIRQIKAMQAVRTNPGMAAPAGWQPGDDLIATGTDQVGAY